MEIKASDTYDNRHFDVIVTTNVAFKMNTEYDVIPEKSGSLCLKIPLLI